jgi:hypothetical protein
MTQRLPNALRGPAIPRLCEGHVRQSSIFVSWISDAKCGGPLVCAHQGVGLTVDVPMTRGEDFDLDARPSP